MYVRPDLYALKVKEEARDRASLLREIRMARRLPVRFQSEGQEASMQYSNSFHIMQASPCPPEQRLIPNAVVHDRLDEKEVNGEHFISMSRIRRGSCPFVW